MQINTSIAQNTNVQSLNARPADKEDAKLKKTCQDFESLLVQQMLSAMRQTVQKSDVFGSREKEDTFQGMLDQEMAVQMSRTGSIKIADVLYKQLSSENDKAASSEPISKAL